MLVLKSNESSMEKKDNNLGSELKYGKLWIGMAQAMLPVLGL